MNIRTTLCLLCLALCVLIMDHHRWGCGLPCPREFSDSAGLARHRRACHHYKHRLDLQAQNFKRRAREDPKHTKVFKRMKPSDETQTTVLSSSSSHPESILNPTSPILDQSRSIAPSPSTNNLIDSNQTTSPGSPPQDPSDVPDFTNHDSRPRRILRLPLRYRDELPQAPLPVAQDQPNSHPTRVILHVFDSIRTCFNTFGIARQYRHRPSYDPDAIVSADELSNIRPAESHISDTSIQDGEALLGSPSRCEPPWPWKNMSIWRLMSWMVTGSDRKSVMEVERLVNDVMKADDFTLDDFEHFNPNTQMKHFDTSEDDDTMGILQRDGWKSTDVKIMVPSREKNPGGNGHEFSVSGLFYRPLISVIQAAFSERSSKWFHLTPFKRIWKSPVTGEEQRLYDELYTSDAWLQAHDELQKQRRDDNCKLERVIAGLMFWSDATHLTQFGSASAWPVYLFFGNLSKYVRSDPNSGACHPIAFIPSLPASITSFISTFIKRKNFDDLLTHCKRELFHAVWRILLDDEFIHAYENGIVIKCHDGVHRRVYPRIFTYSADYPEKVLLATIRDKGNCPCPRCLTPKSMFNRIGFLRDISQRMNRLRKYFTEKVSKARNMIYTRGAPIKGALVEGLLKDVSLVPTVNSFVDRLSPLGFNLFPAIVVDLLHEFELGILKAVLMHLMRLLFAVDPRKIVTIDERFRLIPSFGKGSIRRFPKNVSSMKQRVARHFEDMLQCAIPAFEGLFPEEHDNIIRVLLFRMAEWHALAKMRLHSDDTLQLLDQSLRRLGTQLRKFSQLTCSAFRTMELPTEVSARYKRQHKGFESQSRMNTTNGTGPRPKSFNLFTYKFHALGDYVQSIRTYGTTDSYTTQIGEVAHRLIKKFYRMTNKQDVRKQLAKHERRHTRLRRQQQDLDIEEPIETLPELHHHLSDSWVNVINLATLLRDHSSDPAVKDFIPKLKNHILSRMLGLEYDGDERHFSASDRNELRFIDNLSRVQQPRRFQVNYTTYDVRRDQDSMRPGSNCAVMTLSREEGENAHPFWYALVLRAFRIRVLHTGPQARNRSSQSVEVLWVRWLGVDPTYRWGLKEARLPKVGFVPETDDNAFGFLDPSLVIRGCHLIPAFSEGRSNALLRHGTSLARFQHETDDWAFFYINIFADRDMFARFVGIGVGHEVQYTSSTIRQHSSEYQEDTLSYEDELPDEEDDVNPAEHDVEDRDIEEDDAEDELEDGESDGNSSEDSDSSTASAEDADIDVDEESDRLSDDSDDDEDLYKF